MLVECSLSIHCGWASVNGLGRLVPTHYVQALIEPGLVLARSAIYYLLDV
jgi:hypothetical protein